MNIEKLAYPMFSTTPEEKEELIKAFEIFKNLYEMGGKDYLAKYYLCAYVSNGLREKIRWALYERERCTIVLLTNHRSFSVYKQFYGTYWRAWDEQRKLEALFRMIWIGKLLEYKGK